MLTVANLTALTKREVIQTSGHYRLASVQVTDETGWIRTTAIVYGGHTPATSTIWLKSEDVESKCRVACSCKYFAMHLETVLVMHGSATVNKANGMIPKQRNKKMIPGLCPHLFKLMSIMLLQWKDKDTKKKQTQDEDKEEDEDTPDPRHVNSRLKSMQ